MTSILPHSYAVTVIAVAPAVLGRTSGLLAQYGLLSELVRVGGIGAVSAGFV